MDKQNRPSANPEELRTRESIADELRGLVEDARDLALAEFAYQKSRATYAGVQAAIVVGLVGAALALLFLAIEALVFGAILALSPQLGPIGATGAVIACLLFAALLLVMVALFRWKRMKVQISRQDD